MCAAQLVVSFLYCLYDFSSKKYSLSEMFFVAPLNKRGYELHVTVKVMYPCKKCVSGYISIQRFCINGNTDVKSPFTQCKHSTPPVFRISQGLSPTRYGAVCISSHVSRPVLPNSDNSADFVYQNILFPITPEWSKYLNNWFGNWISAKLSRKSTIDWEKRGFQQGVSQKHCHSFHST